MIDLFHAIWHQDVGFLQQYPHIWLLVLCLFLILMIESAFVFLPLPGDSIVIFGGALVGLGIVDPSVSIVVIPAAAAVGGYLAYEQGRWLEQRPSRFNIERLLPDGTLNRAAELFRKHGILALFAARFLPFVRVLVPMLMGAARLSRRRFALVNAISAWCWAGCLGFFGAFVVNTPFYEEHSALIARTAVLLPLALFASAIAAVLYRHFRTQPPVLPKVTVEPPLTAAPPMDQTALDQQVKQDHTVR
ncbi:DedA family protein [Ferrimonas balearica]|uniref:DedA family protein n=1 Tax=Ferrimonas balearica TaxID=44012 RepID=UPI001F317FF9|nr:DedA family protein [Ferrimonas balearica]MBY6016832.1 DedA family protein [Halomonas denitrificans]MBY6094878.1 DedA family protein [Ferrimonas balearica]